MSTWKFDGEETTAAYVTLTSGTHTVEAVLSDSRTLSLRIVVQ